MKPEKKERTREEKSSTIRNPFAPSITLCIFPGVVVQDTFTLPTSSIWTTYTQGQMWEEHIFFPTRTVVFQDESFPTIARLMPVMFSGVFLKITGTSTLLSVTLCIINRFSNSHSFSSAPIHVANGTNSLKCAGRMM